MGPCTAVPAKATAATEGTIDFHFHFGKAYSTLCQPVIGLQYAKRHHHGIQNLCKIQNARPTLTKAQKEAGGPQNQSRPNTGERLDLAKAF